MSLSRMEQVRIGSKKELFQLLPLYTSPVNGRISIISTFHHEALELCRSVSLRCHLLRVARASRGHTSSTTSLRYQGSCSCETNQEDVDFVETSVLVQLDRESALRWYAMPSFDTHFCSRDVRAWKCGRRCWSSIGAGSGQLDRGG